MYLRALLTSLISFLALAAAAVVPGGWLGVELDENDPQKIARVIADSPAAKAGLRAGDRIMAVGDFRVRNADGLFSRFETTKPGDRVRITVLRGRNSLTVEATLGQMPAPNEESARPAQPAKSAPRAKPVEPDANARQAAKSVPAQRSKNPTQNGRQDSARPFLGAGLSEVENGLRVYAIVPKSSAALVGLRVADVITMIDGKSVIRDAAGARIEPLDGYDRLMGNAKVGQRVRFTMTRDGTTRDVLVVLAARPGSEAAGGNRPPAAANKPPAAANRPLAAANKPLAAAKVETEPTLPKSVVPESAAKKPADVKPDGASAGAIGEMGESLSWALGAARQHGKRVLVLFGSTWVKSTAVQRQAIRRLAAMPDGRDLLFVYIDTDKQRDLADRFGVQGLPDLRLLDANGRALHRWRGYQAVEALVHGLRQHAAAHRPPPVRTQPLPGQPRPGEPRPGEPRSVQPRAPSNPPSVWSLRHEIEELRRQVDELRRVVDAQRREIDELKRGGRRRQ